LIGGAIFGWIDVELAAGKDKAVDLGQLIG